MPDSGDLEPGSNLSERSSLDPSGEDQEGRGRWAKMLRIALVLLIGVGGAGYASFEVHDRLTNIHEVDARISADVITLSSKVSGIVTGITVTEGDPVTAGEILITIDSEASQFRVGEMQAQIASLGAEFEQKVAEKRLLEKQLTSRRASVGSLYEAAKVTVSSLEPQQNLARREFERVKSLFEKRVVSRRQLDEAERNLEEIEREYRIATANLKAAEARVLEAEAERERLAVVDRELLVYDHRQAEIKARLAAQNLDLRDRTIRAPIGGVIDRVFVIVGEFIEPGQRLALVHDPERIWIDANIKETEIRKVSLGDKVEVMVDAFPDRPFEGRVEIIGNTTTAEFALLPTPNPSGNFTKITQRLPVRIAIDQHDNLLRPGMMVEIRIDADQSPGGGSGTGQTSAVQAPPPPAAKGGS